MRLSRQPFEPIGSGGSRLLRTFAGLIVVLGLIAGGTAWLMINPVTSGSDVSSESAPVLYLSAAAGNFFVIEVDENEQEQSRLIKLGDNLEPGAQYRTSAEGMALLRSSSQELSFLLDSGSTIMAGGTFDPVPVTLINGSMIVHSMGDESGNGVSLDLSGATVHLSPMCIATFGRDGEAFSIDTLEGIVNLDLNGEKFSVAGGERGALRNGAFQVTPGAYLRSPEPYRPAAGTLFRRNADSEQEFIVELQWSQVPESDQYRVEISGDILFQRPLAQRSTGETRLALSDVLPGRYYWRVTALKGQQSGAPSRPIAFSVQETAGTDDETISSPELQLFEVAAQSNLVSIRGQTEPGAHIVMYLESYGRLITEPREVLVSPTGAFRAQLDAPQRGELVVVVQAFYRPEIVTHKSATVFVDF